MPSRDPRLTEPPQPDLEQLPFRHYRGRGARQDATGPSGAWLERGPARFMTPPARGDEERPTIGPWPVADDLRARPPRNFRRRDDRIYEDVRDAIALHGDFDASDLKVQVSDGDVILRGTVRSRWAKLYAEDLALGVLGVRDVVNELRVRPRGAPTSG
jgi:hypothetical protein